MTRPLAFILSVFAILSFRPTYTQAQIYFPRLPYPRPHAPPVQLRPDPAASPVEVGAYFTLGRAGLEEPHIDGVGVGVGGVYGQWNRSGLCPGLDLRLHGNESYLHGVLVGPRLAYRPSESNPFRGFHPYVEALFGPNELPSTPAVFDLYPPSYRGVTSAAIIGLDVDLSAHFRFRLVEFSKETFSGLHGVNPYSITTGFVLHLP